MGFLHELALWSCFAARWCSTCTANAAACAQPWGAGALFGGCTLSNITMLAVLLECCSRGTLPDVSR